MPTRTVDDLLAWQPKEDEEKKQGQPAATRSVDELLAWQPEVPKPDSSAQREQMLDYARKSLEESYFPGLKTTAVQLGAAPTALVARAIGQDEKADFINRFADAFATAKAETDTGGKFAKTFKRGLRGVGVNLPTSILAGPAGPYAIIGQAAATEANQAITEARDAGLEGADVFKYAVEQGAIEGGVASMFQKVGLGGLENVLGGKTAVATGVTSALKQAGIATAQELPEELITELGHNVARSLSGVDPKATSPEALAQTAADTTMQTLLTMGFVGAGQVASTKFQGDILATADEGKVPSRKQWKEWGLDPEQGKTARGRAEGVQQAAESIRQQQAAAEPVAEATQPEAPQEAAPDAAVQEMTTNEQAMAPPVLPFIEQLKNQAAEALPQPESLLAGESGTQRIGGPQGPIRDDVIGTPGQQVDLDVGIKEVDERMTAAHGLPKESYLDKLKAGLEKVKNYVTRAQVNVPNTPEFAPFNETMRLMKAVPSAARNDAVRTVIAITQPLGPQQFKLFSRYSIVQNQLAAIEQGQPLRFGFKDKNEVVAYRDKLQALVDATPEVKQAVENRTKAVQDIVAASINYKLLPEEALQNSETYYHQQVLAYQAGQRKGVGAAIARRFKKSFQKKRFASSEVDALDANYDYNTDYLQAEISWMSDAMEQIRKEQLLDQMESIYDRHAEFAAKAEANGTSLGREVDADGTVDIFQARPGNAFYRAYSIPEKVAEQLQQGVLESFDLTKDQVREVLAVGAQRKPLVLPKEIVAELEATKKPTAPHWLDKLNTDAIRQWKAWSLLQPFRVIPYNVRNMTGDIDPIIAANPEILKYTKEAASEVWKMVRQPTAKMSDEMRLAQTYGVTSSGFFTEEIGEVSGINAFKYLDEKGDALLRAVLRPDKAYMDAIRPLVDAREDLMRYAAFKFYRNALKNNNLTNYGASKKPIIDAVRAKMGDDVAAAKLARELVGDYGNLTAAGHWLRTKLYPFWAFQEINLKRYPQLIYNSFQEAGLRQGLGTTASVARTYAAATTMRVGAMYGALYVWNNLIAPSIFGGSGDDDLPTYDRANPHIVLGNGPDGDKLLFRNVGALGDFLEWFGLNETIALIPKIRSGQVGARDIAVEIAKSPIDKIVGGLRPDIKGGFELLTGQSLFPSPFEPRSVARDEAAANIVGMGQEYKWAKGMALGTGDRARKNYWLRAIGIASVDPRASALSEIYDLRNRFLESKGSQESGTYPISEYKVAREASINEDYNAFVDWKVQFMKKHPHDAGARFFRFIKKMDPVASRLNDRDEIEFEQKYLTGEQREKLRVARDYSRELAARLLVWWRASAKNDNKLVE